MKRPQSDQDHAAFLKRNGALISLLLEHTLSRPPKSKLSLLEELTVLVATNEVCALLDGRQRRTFTRLFRATSAQQRASWTPREWADRLRLAGSVALGAPKRLSALHAKLGRREDFPKLTSMRKWGHPQWYEMMKDIRADTFLAAAATSLILDREELPGGPSLTRMYSRLGFELEADGRPPDLALFPEDVRRSKWLLAGLAHDTCTRVSRPAREACQPCPIKTFCKAYRDATRPRREQGPTFVDVFAGGGGLSLGLTMAGLHLRLAVEKEQHAADTLYLNHPEAPNGVVDARDIRDLLKDRKKLSKLRGIDVIAGGPPCQPFSMARRHSEADRKDPRRFLFRSYIELVRRLRPRIVILENVPGIENAAGGNISEAIHDEFAAIGYAMQHQLLNAADYGVPQNRQRFFFIGVRRRDFRDPNATLRGIFEQIQKSKRNGRTAAREALSGIPRLKAGAGAQVVRKSSRGRLTRYGREMSDRSAELLHNHETRPHNPRDLAIFKALKWGETAEQLEGRRPGTIPYQLESFSDKYRKIHPHRPAPTIPAHLHRDANSFVHFSVPRGITAREAARFQSFPDRYVFLGGFGHAFIQIGNAVPPKLAEVVGRAVKDALASARQRRRPGGRRQQRRAQSRAPRIRGRASGPARGSTSRVRRAPGSTRSSRARTPIGPWVRRNARGSRARSSRGRKRPP